MTEEDLARAGICADATFGACDCSICQRPTSTYHRIPRYVVAVWMAAVVALAALACVALSEVAT